MDDAIAHSLTFEQFIRRLRDAGYEVKVDVKHIAVRPPGKERFTRLRRLGDDYTEEALRQRILQNDPSMLAVKESTLGQMAQSGQAPLPSV